MAAEFGYVRVGTAVPPVRPGAARENVAALTALAAAADAEDCDVVVYPELCVTAYTCADLFQQRALLDEAERGLAAFVRTTRERLCVHVLGLPVAQNGLLYNCAAIVQAGRICGVVPKTYIPGHKEYYEPRWFVSGDLRRDPHIQLCGERVPFGNDLIFGATKPIAFSFGVELCEDLWAPVPPSSRLALAGAQVLLNLSASNEAAGKADYRRTLVQQQSARCLAAYAYASAGVGESTTDLVFGGHCLIAENGLVLAENERFRRGDTLQTVDIDIDFLEHERIHNVTFGKAVARESERARGMAGNGGIRAVAVETRQRAAPVKVRRPLAPRPFIPPEGPQRLERCREILAIQSTGLATRLEHSGFCRAVIGLSGGLDSTLALLVTRDAFARLGLESAGIQALTMPGFGTSDRTRQNVEALCLALQVPLDTVHIDASCRQHLRDIGHDGATGDITYENAQARERTQILMDKANMLHALVIGTGDLSELALGWCTYNGDHMSMYAVNSGVPKTLVRFLIQYFAEAKADADTAAVLHDILATPISPELLPPDASGAITQETEAVIGPYELHDFFLYHGVRCGFAPEKVLYLAVQAFAGQYEPDAIKSWLRLFYERFFSQQFKRSCLPDGPKVGTIALSPRGDWRMPSDASPEDWLRRLSDA